MVSLCIPRSHVGVFGTTEPQHRLTQIRRSENLRNLRSFPKSDTAMMGVDNGAESHVSGSVSTMDPIVVTSSLPVDTAEQANKPSSTNPSIVAATNIVSTEQLLDSDPKNSASTPKNYGDVEALSRRINDSVMIKDLPIKSSQSVEVSKGYTMELGLTPSGFIKYRAKVVAQVKKRKREQTLPKWTQRDWQSRLRGFRPEEVNWNGAIYMKDCQPSNLTNDIHPLFDRACFDDTPDAIYDELIPALRLATLFLTQPICMQFWVTLAMGHRSDDPEMTAKNGKQSQRISAHIELTKERARTVINHLKDVGKSRLIHFRFNRIFHMSDNTRMEGNVYAISQPICDYKGIDTEYHGVKGMLVRSIIRFHSDYYVIAKKLSQLKYQEASQKLRFSFGFAALIVHEIAHSIEGIHFRERDHQWLDWQTSGYYKEPYWLDWKVSECGRAWEETMFGGHLEPINGRVDGSHGVGIADWPFGGSDEDPERFKWWTVSMNYIEHMFQMSTWQRKFELKDWRIFNIPRDGATSVYLNSFTTMKPSEEERVAKEETAELLARAKEEPAAKKRLTASGVTEEHRLDEETVIEHAVAEAKVESPQVLPKREVPNFPGTRRLSSVMPGPLPSVQAHRKILIPHTRKASLDMSSAPKDLTPMSSTGEGFKTTPSARRSRSHDGFTFPRRESLEDQHPRDLEQSPKDQIAEELPPALPDQSTKPTFAMPKRSKTGPKGMMDKYRARKKEQLARKLVQPKEEQEIVDKKSTEELVHADDNGAEIAKKKDSEETQDLPPTLDGGEVDKGEEESEQSQDLPETREANSTEEKGPVSDSSTGNQGVVPRRDDNEDREGQRNEDKAIA